MLVRARHVVKEVRARVPRKAHLLERGLLHLGDASDDGFLVSRVVEIHFDGRAVGQRHDVPTHPLAIPDFVQANAHALNVSPIHGGNSRVTLNLP